MSDTEIFEVVDEKSTAMHNTKKDFPIFKKHTDLIYLDNAASTQKPQAVIDAMMDFYTNEYANIHRGLYRLSQAATQKYLNAKATVAQFINAEPDEIVFENLFPTKVTPAAQEKKRVWANPIKVKA